MHGAQRAISILSPETPHPDFASLGEGQHLRLTFHDVIDAVAGLKRQPTRMPNGWLLSFPLGTRQRRCSSIAGPASAAPPPSAFTAMCLLRASDR